MAQINVVVVVLHTYRENCPVNLDSAKYSSIQQPQNNINMALDSVPSNVENCKRLFSRLRTGSNLGHVGERRQF